MSETALWEMGLQSIKELETSEGVLASARSEAYGCIFGRDSLIVALELLETYEHTGDVYFLTVVEKILRTLGNLQGRSDNIESGEEPGKIVHEFRPDNHEHLTRLQESPWFIYPEGDMRNYDSVDSTLLFLLAAHAYLEAGGEKHFFISILPNVRAALHWLLVRADSNGDGFIDYSFHPERRFGGLKVQSWMDSTESLFYEEDETTPTYPIAPVEAQAYAWAACKRWASYFVESEPELSQQLAAKAEELKQKFNEHFVLKGPKSVTLAFALDGQGRKLTAPRSSMGHVLWAAYKSESILYVEYVEPLRRRLMARDLFVPKAGIRTLSSRSLHFDSLSYHNGSIWPHDTAMLAKGLESFGFKEDASRVRAALLNAYTHFKTPIELFGYKRGFREYRGGACRTQAWSAASMLSIAGVPQTSL